MKTALDGGRERRDRQFYRGAARSVSLSHLLPPRGPPLRPGGGGTPDPKSPPSRGGGIFLSPGKFALAGHFPGFPPPLPGSYRVSSRPGARRPVCGRDTRHSRGFFRSRSAALSSSLGSHKSPVTISRYSHFASYPPPSLPPSSARRSGIFLSPATRPGVPRRGDPPGSWGAAKLSRRSNYQGSVLGKGELVACNTDNLIILNLMLTSHSTQIIWAFVASVSPAHGYLRGAFTAPQ